jgi:hypothetical protein
VPGGFLFADPGSLPRQRRLKAYRSTSQTFTNIPANPLLRYGAIISASSGLWFRAEGTNVVHLGLP